MIRQSQGYTTHTLREVRSSNTCVGLTKAHSAQFSSGAKQKHVPPALGAFLRCDEQVRRGTSCPAQQSGTASASAANATQATHTHTHTHTHTRQTTPNTDTQGANRAMHWTVKNGSSGRHGLCGTGHAAGTFGKKIRKTHTCVVPEGPRSSIGLCRHGVCSEAEYRCEYRQRNKCSPGDVFEHGIAHCASRAQRAHHTHPLSATFPGWPSKGHS